MGIGPRGALQKSDRGTIAARSGRTTPFRDAYTSWAIGTVEVVNREILKCMKALLNERRVAIRDWLALLPVVQAALNSMPADRLGGKALITAFTTLSGGTQLTSILHPRDPEEASVNWVAQEIQDHLESVRVALDGPHAEMANASEKRRRIARERHARRQGKKFSEGDLSSLRQPLVEAAISWHLCGEAPNESFAR
ncbi:unnamed protein product [Phytophthora fragariaefolia]|uniref:Unnamed protein product n=1 Tax=Phytophthora fragariaefolia TaxID=1490495 RepID=A0A9W6X068_9STRA|nr:unnamed protein product [Phytophthora fragariaefolia]